MRRLKEGLVLLLRFKLLKTSFDVFWPYICSNNQNKP